ncbi:DUF465 domain-containing protein [Oceanibacterium hippocampi]|uniref:DUF465 domain-containing protein n=1 Tax=Oceanibacterium hippocampi TaxID=745714 RepID=A0A1Y5SC01_9PROT|nr:DUF465 domain-containing protein [Oceanibacterium hippocampi]SLN35756.1 hypothetical protein OCH7691_01432 [Oceanibacterium hippocampi]
MSLVDHLRQLNEKHRSLDERIEQEVHRPSPDNIKLTDLKRKKLKLKERIAELEHEIH